MNTRNLNQLGFREINQLADLLKVYSEYGCPFLGSQVDWEYNPNSDNLFLVDEDFNIAMLNGDKLEQWFSCSECGHEGFAEDFGDEGNCNKCL